MHIVAPDTDTSLPQEKGVVPGLELCPASESCDQVSCDKTGGRTVLWSGQSGVGNFKPCLLDCHAGESPSWDLGCIPMEKIW